MMKKRCFLTLVGLLFLMSNGNAQVAWLTPENPPPDIPATLTFDAKKGNGNLAGYGGDVYFHTGVITDKSIDGGDWKHVTGNWGEADQRVKMTSLGNDLYEVTFVINDFYQLSSEEIPQQLAFVFRSETGSHVGKTKTNEDVFLSVNGYVPPIRKAPEYAFESRKYISHTLVAGQELRVLTDHGLISILPYDATMINVKHFSDSVATSVASEAVIMESQSPSLTVVDDRAWLTLITDSLKVLVHKSPVYVAFVYHNDTILREERGYFKRDETEGLRFEMQQDEQFFGLGERANAINLKGVRYNLYNRPKYGYEIGARNLNYAVPLVVSNHNYLLLFDNPQKGYADLGESEPGIMEWGAIGGQMQYDLVVGKDFKTISHSYARLTGFQPLPPLWALGNLQSRMAYKTQYETDSIVNLMQKEDFPIDAIILDFYWFGDSIMGTMGRLDWYKPGWPDPKKMIDDFKQVGVKTVLITEPYIIDSLKNFKITSDLGILATDESGKTYVNQEFYFGPAGLIDIFNPLAGDWFWKAYQPQIELGVAGWWGDLGEPENHPSDQIHVLGKADEVHNIYAHYWHRMLFNKYRKHYPEKRLFNLNRAGYAGSQRYSIYPWTGDVSRSWGGLQAQLPLMIHMSMSGLPFIHSDAGGFAQGTRDDALYTRWLQMACFSPILRPHGSGIPSEPIYFNEMTKVVVRKFMKLRYSLLPYIYTLTYESHTLGYPMVRPLFYELPKDTRSYQIDDEYMFGPDLLVAPILTRDQEMRKVYLPAGVSWYNFWNNKLIKGGQSVALPVSIHDIPVFVKAGSFIARTIPVNSTDEYTTQNLDLDYYLNPGTQTDSGQLYLDDGALFGAVELGAYRLMKFKGQKKNNGESLVVTITPEGNGYTSEPDAHIINLRLIGEKVTYKKVVVKRVSSGHRVKYDILNEDIEKTRDGWQVSFPVKDENIEVTFTK